MNKIIHKHHGQRCACGIDEVLDIHQEALSRFDNWYGDKSYRYHQDVLEMIQPLVERITNQRNVIQGLQGQLIERDSPVIRSSGIMLEIGCDGSDHPGQTCDEWDAAMDRPIAQIED